MFRSTKDEYDLKEIENFIEEHRKQVERYQKLQRYYQGQHDILQTRRERGKPNYKLVNAYPRYIVDMLVGYFVGQSIRYSNKADGKDKDLEKIIESFDYADEAAHNLELAKTCSIKGKGFEILYTDSFSKPRLACIQPDEMFAVYGDSIENLMKYAVRYYGIKVNGKSVRKIEIYTKDKIYYYKQSDNTMTLEREQVHYFGDVPVVEYKNNQEELGDFEHVLSLVDAYDLAQSNTINDMEQFTDAYLMLVNLSGTEDKDIDKMKKDRVLLLNEKGQAGWLVKEVNDAWVENYKTRLKQDIHKFSATPDMTDKEFGSNLSGVSLRYKLLAMEQVRASKERKFRNGLQRRLELFFAILKITKSIDEYTDIEISFSNTLPQNVYELSQTIQNLLPIVSKETLLSQLPFIASAKDEIEKYQAESIGLDEYNNLQEDEHEQIE
ncbi:MAG: phage portal protein [Peptostreptococcaceae bacterium]|nr:phage portal protein [Peptostreptococcaceae bacterium]